MNGHFVEIGVPNERRKEILKRKVMKKIENYSVLLFILAVIAMMLAVGDTQIGRKLYSQKKMHSAARNNYSISKNHLEDFHIPSYLFALELVTKSLISLITLITCSVVYILYKKTLEFKILRNFYPPTMSLFFASDLTATLLVEMFVCLIHIPPLAHKYLGISYRLQVIVFLRIYHIGRFMKWRHQFMRSKLSPFLASLTETDLTPMFLMRTFFMQHPFYTVLSGYIFVLFAGGYVLWLIEGYHLSYAEVLWMIVITSTTVGYGDLTPQTVWGRILIGFMSLFGIVIFATMVQLINNHLGLSMKEKRILQYVVRQETQMQKKIIALNAIGMWYKYYSYRRKHFYFIQTNVSCVIPKSTREVQMQVIIRIKAYILEQKMINAINLWRKSKTMEWRYNFTHEFMVGDINAMVSQLLSDIPYLMGKREESKKNSKWDINCPRKGTSSIANYRNKWDKGGVNNARNVDGNNKNNNFHDLVFSHEFCNGNQMFLKHPENCNDNANPSYNNCNCINGNDSASTDSERINHYRKALKLLENQIIIMNSNLEDSYREISDEHFNTHRKMKRDLQDLHNIIRSLKYCLERETFA